MAGRATEQPDWWRKPSHRNLGESVLYCYKVIKLLGRLSPEMERCTLSLEECQPRTGFTEQLKVKEKETITVEVKAEEVGSRAISHPGLAQSPRQSGNADCVYSALTLTLCTSPASPPRTIPCEFAVPSTYLVELQSPNNVKYVWLL